MSTLTQRFLTELDSEWSHLPAPERQSLRERIATRLEALTLAERELGASEAEAQQRAVRAVGQECTLQPQIPVRLAPVWQVMLIWITMSEFLATILRLFGPGMVMLPGGYAAYMPGWLVTQLLGYGGATVIAALWHPRAAWRGVLAGLAIVLSFKLASICFYALSPQPNATLLGLQKDILGSGWTLLGSEVGVTLGTLVLFQKLRTKKLSKTL